MKLSQLVSLPESTGQKKNYGDVVEWKGAAQSAGYAVLGNDLEGKVHAEDDDGNIVGEFDTEKDKGWLNESVGVPNPTPATKRNKKMADAVVGMYRKHIKTSGYNQTYAKKHPKEMNEARPTPKLGARREYDSYKLWKADLPAKKTFHKSGSIERAQAFGKDFEGVAGAWDYDKSAGWIYAYYLDKTNIRESTIMESTGSAVDVKNFKLPQLLGCHENAGYHLSPADYKTFKASKYEGFNRSSKAHSFYVMWHDTEQEEFAISRFFLSLGEEGLLIAEPSGSPIKTGTEEEIRKIFAGYSGQSSLSEGAFIVKSKDGVPKKFKDANSQQAAEWKNSTAKRAPAKAEKYSYDYWLEKERSSDAYVLMPWAKIKEDDADEIERIVKDHQGTGKYDWTIGRAGETSIDGTPCATRVIRIQFEYGPEDDMGVDEPTSDVQSITVARDPKNPKKLEFMGYA